MNHVYLEPAFSPEGPQGVERGSRREPQTTNLVYPERSRRELQILNFIKNLIYLLLFSLFLLIPVAKKFYEIRATNFDKLCKTNPICRKPKMNATKVLTKGYENIRPRSRAENKPNDPSCINAAQFSLSLCCGAGLFPEVRLRCFAPGPLGMNLAEGLADVSCSDYFACHIKLEADKLRSLGFERLQSASTNFTSTWNIDSLSGPAAPSVGHPAIRARAFRPWPSFLEFPGRFPNAV
jgi:hypothetical protein